jgi:hypothetical protein
MIDFKDFIRLSEFLDSTIFKVTSDSSPARSTTTVGVIVEPSILERGKGSEIKSGVKLTHFSPKRIRIKPTVGHNEAKYYSQLEGNRMPYFTGRISGSNVTYYRDFQTLNENKYATNRSFTADDTYAFNHSKYKALLNNIYNERLSSIYSKVEYLNPITSSSIFVRGINSFITGSFKFQDSYTNMTSFTVPRYEGSKNKDYDSLLLYSTSGSITVVTNKVGVFNNFKKDLFLPNKTILEVKYLSDKDGNLTVLNSSNKNLGDLQKIFRPNDKLTIGFFRNAQNKNDKRYIYETGYSYRPVFYFASSSDSTKNDSKLNFEYLNGYNPNDSSATNGNVIIKIAPGKTSFGSTYPDYQTDFTVGTPVTIYGVFDYHNQIGETNANGKYTNSSYSNIVNSKFIASSTTSYQVSSQFNIEPVFSSGGSVSYSIKIIKNGTVYKTITQNAQNKAEVDFYVFNVADADILPRLNSFLEDAGQSGATYASNNVWSWDGNLPKFYTKINVKEVQDKGYYKPATRSGGLITILQNNGVSDSFKIINENKLFTYDNGAGYVSEVEIVRQSIFSTTNPTAPALFVSYYRKPRYGYTGAVNTYFPDDTVSGIDATNSNLQITIPMVVNESIPLVATDTLEFQLLKTIASGTMLYERIQTGDFSIKGSSLVNSIGITIDPTGNTIAFSNGLSFVYGATRFIPFSNPENNNSKAWSTFGTISEDFIINKNSFVLFVYNSYTGDPTNPGGVQKRLIRIKDLVYSKDKGQWYLNTDDIPGDLATDLIIKQVEYKVCFLSRFLDETSVILNYTFTDNEFGTTSNNSGFIVPISLNPDMQSNLDTVVSTIKNKTNLVTNI